MRYQQLDVRVVRMCSLRSEISDTETDIVYPYLLDALFEQFFVNVCKVSKQPPLQNSMDEHR
jgi:hypothetical protein